MPLTADSQITHGNLPTPFHHAGRIREDMGMFIRPLALQLLRKALCSHTTIPRTAARVESLIRIAGREDSRSSCTGCVTGCPGTAIVVAS